MKKFIIAAIALTLSIAVVPAEPDPALLKTAQAAEPAVIDTLHEMVSIESGTTDAVGLSRIADYVERRLQALGAHIERIKPTVGHTDMVKGSFVGSGRLRILLIAHLDTVYPAGTLAEQPYKRIGNLLYGPGIADAKGGVAVILHSIAILNAQNWHDYARLTVLFNGDEESISVGSGETIAALGTEHDVVLSFEPTASKIMAKTEGVLMSAAGSARATLDVRGRTSHAGAAPELGRNALIELAYQLLQTQDAASKIPGIKLNWTVAQAGAARNQIPDSAHAIGDVRMTQVDAEVKLQAALQATVTNNHRVPETQVNVTIEIGRPIYIAGPRGLALAELARTIYAELDRPLIFHPGTGGGTDAGFAGRSGKPAVLESLGLAGWGYHAGDEYIEIDSIVPRLYLVTRMLQELGKAH